MNSAGASLMFGRQKEDDASRHPSVCAGTIASVRVRPSVWSRPGSGPGGLAGIAAERAEALIAASRGDRLTVGQLARAVGVSVRTLCRSFQQLRGYGPTEAVRRARLLRARQDLLLAGDRERVTDVAMRWGFCHLGRFSGVYAARFGELPSETRRRASVRARQGAGSTAMRA